MILLFVRMVRFGKVSRHCFADPDENYLGFSVESGKGREWKCQHRNPITGEVEEYVMTVLSIDMLDTANGSGNSRAREGRNGGQEEYFDAEEIKLHIMKRHPKGNVKRIPYFTLISIFAESDFDE